ncbi:MAG: hypothetical protein AAFZ05_03065, partial [Pseudomonadota bacterium]
MADLIQSGRIADILLAILTIEAVVLWLVLRLRDGAMAEGARAIRLFGLLLPGVMFVVALRLALTGAAWPWIAVVLALAGAAHAFDVWQRF